jgi:alcohol dehydrogenase (cytochrome c)
MGMPVSVKRPPTRPGAFRFDAVSPGDYQLEIQPGFRPSVSQEGLDPAKLLQPPTDTWPMYHGDYSGRRYSPLTGINSSNVKGLTTAWSYRTGVGGIKATPLEINGILYFAAPDHAWAVDARTGKEVWHFPWESNES